VARGGMIVVEYCSLVSLAQLWWEPSCRCNEKVIKVQLKPKTGYATPLPDKGELLCGVEGLVITILGRGRNRGPCAKNPIIWSWLASTLHFLSTAP
jgi:hypothetical protein